ncbi:MAG: exodeoxyribonuclease VII large subunit [Haliscomenobacteraceae bacterium CHB4]|nr:Exodeoxyribonuclease 7 large subunit [Saprospiraceae bacterium]MCE7922607.1 exodeoxyribonuclease VII large subunit [Haliscomenobacteraceae bacterium CHB4]
MVYSLFDLNEHIRRVLALNFQQAVWIAAEIAQAGQSRGHFYLDLVQKGEGDDILAQGQAVLWANDLRRLRNTIGSELDMVLREGLEVKLQVRVDFHERYGLKLIVTDLEPAYTFGQIELRRRQTVQTLRELGLLERNRALQLPSVLQRIAVVSSEDAAGFQDFREHLANNSFGYRFGCRLFASAVQGKNAETELREALEQVALLRDAFDCAVIVRGGGARLDLAAFDGLEVCQTVAQMPLPVFTGIGHDVDETVLDLVAHASLKTPTAVADFLLQHNLFFENEVLRMAENIRVLSDYRLKINQMDVERFETALQWSSRERLRAAVRRLDVLEESIPGLAVQLLRRQSRQLDQAEAFCLALHPENVLRRGYSLTMKNGKAVTSATEVEAGDLLETRLRKGTIRSKVT